MAKFFSLLAAPLLLAAPASCQVPPSPDRPLGPGDPLPPLTLKHQGLELEGSRGVATDGDLRFGDVRLRAERITFDNATLRIEAAGNFVWTRGDERASGNSFLFDPENGIGVAQNAVAVSPPFYVSGARIEQTPAGIRAYDALVTPCPEGRGELRITARQVDLVNDRYLILRRPTFFLFGLRLLSLPRYRYIVTRGRGQEREEYALSIPIRIRTSKIAGLVVGAGSGFYLGSGYEGNVSVDLPSKRPTQYALTVTQDFGTRARDERGRGQLVDPTRRVSTQPESPLRAFLRARPLPPPPDPVLDFEDVLPLENPLTDPTRTPTRDVLARLSAVGNREIGDKRQNELLLSSVPELRVTGRLPLTTPVPPDNAAARRYLRRPRPLLTGEITLGRYEERELEVRQRSTEQERAGVAVTAGTLPLLVGNRFLLRPQAGLTYWAYSGGSSYRVAELNLAGAYVLGPRTALGAALIRRFTSGATPFTFDVVDTQNEAQGRIQVASRGGKYTLGLLGRYDVDQRQFFDFQIALAIRLRCIEPRLSYRRLNQQIGLTLTIPGLLP